MGVPRLPGVPALASYAAPIDLALSLLTSDGPFSFFGLLAPQWGIFLDGAPVVVADNVVAVVYRQEWAVSDYPVEEGAFASYDKVQIPFDVRVRFSAGGSEANRQALLDSVAAIAPDTNKLYTVVTPEVTLPSVTISHYDYQRTAQNGVGLLQVDVWCLNVVVIAASTSGQSTASPAAAGQTNGGTVAPVANDGSTPDPAFPPSFPGQP